MNSLVYDYLGNYPQHIPVIAEWHQNEWSHISPELTTKKRIENYSLYRNQPDIPCCIIALEDGNLAGSVSLVKCDLETRPHMGPWLASLYVNQAFRSRGIASGLIEACLDIARQLNIPKIYLFTPDQTAFYQKRGWQIVESTSHHGESIDIMSYDMNDL